MRWSTVMIMTMMVMTAMQSVTSRLETSRYRDFSQFFESIGLDLENFGLEKKSRYRSRKNLVSKKSRYRSRKHLVSKKSLGIGLENIWSQKKSRYRSQKYLVSKKSLGLENLGLEKKSR